MVDPLHAITGIKATFVWGFEQQLAFNEIKKALIDATALAQPDSDGKFASAVAILGILHQWQGPPGKRRLRPIVYGSKKLTATRAKYGAPKLEMYAGGVPLHCEEPQLPMSAKVHVEGGQSGAIVVENVLN